MSETSLVIYVMPVKTGIQKALEFLIQGRRDCFIGLQSEIRPDSRQKHAGMTNVETINCDDNDACSAYLPQQSRTSPHNFF